MLPVEHPRSTSGVVQSIMAFSNISTDSLKKKIDDVRRFLSVSLRIANAHTVDFYTRDVWRAFTAVEPEEVLTAVNSPRDHTGAPEGTFNSVACCLAT